MFTNTVKNHKDFILHNKKIFSKNIKKNRSIFLIEFNNWQGVQIANSYLINSIPYIKNFLYLIISSGVWLHYWVLKTLECIYHLE